MDIGNINSFEEISTEFQNEETLKKTNIKKYSKIGKIFKRTIDILGSFAGIILLIPIVIVLSVTNLFRKNKQKIFYSQDRIGKNGKIFKMYKFQTMIPNANEYLDKYLNENEEARAEYKINKKLKDDPRITDIGKVLRRTSIDEFPQFINVLKGDMSLVGPRPYMISEKEEMGKYYEQIIKVQPGITGLWQVSGRNELTFKERLEIESEYSKEFYLRKDISILFKTVKGVLNKKGAL